MATLYRAFGRRSPLAEPVADIIFVHGLGGDAFGTWSHSEEELDWPEWVADEFPDRAVWRLSYESHPFRASGMWYQDQAKNILDCLMNENLGVRPIIYICHSLGGILVKQALRVAQVTSQFRRIYDATRSVAFIATPHTGAAVATLLNWLEIGSDEARQLRLDDPALRDLNEWYRTAALADHIRTAAYAEMRSTAGIMIVGPTQADPGVADCIVVPLPSDHISIVKPGRNDQILASIARLIRDTPVLLITPAFVDAAEDHRRRFLRYGDSAGQLRKSGRSISLAAVYVNREQQESRVRALYEAHAKASGDGTWVSIQGSAGTGKTSLLWYLYHLFSKELNASVQAFAAQYISETLKEERGLIARWLTTTPGQKHILLIDTLDLIVGRGDTALAGFLAWLRTCGVFVVTSCRPLEAQRLAAVEVADHIVPLGRYTEAEARTAVHRYVAMAYGEADPIQRTSQESDLWNLLDGRRRVQELSFDPLVLRMIFEAYPPDPVPSEVNTAMIYTAYWERCVVRDRLQPSTPDSEQLREALAGRIAYSILFRESTTFSDAIQSTAVQLEWENFDQRFGAFPWKLLDALLSSGALEAAGGVGTVRFFHQTLLEFAAGRHVLRSAQSLHQQCLDQIFLDLQNGSYFRVPVLAQIAIQDSQSGGTVWHEVLIRLFEIGSETSCYLTLEILGKVDDGPFGRRMIEDWKTAHLSRLVESAVAAVSHYPRDRISVGLNILAAIIQTEAKYEVFALCEQRLADLNPVATSSFLEGTASFITDNHTADDDIRGHYKTAALTCFYNGCPNALSALSSVFSYLNAGHQRGVFGSLTNNLTPQLVIPVCEFLSRVRSVLYGNRASELVDEFLRLITRIHTLEPAMASRVATEVLEAGKPRQVEDEARLRGGLSGGVLKTPDTIRRAIEQITSEHHLDRLTGTAMLRFSDASEHAAVLESFLSLRLTELPAFVRSSLFEVVGDLYNAPPELVFRFLSYCPWPENAIGKAWRKISANMAAAAGQNLKAWLWERFEKDQKLSRVTAVGLGQLLKANPGVFSEAEISRILERLISADVNCQRAIAERAGAIACVAPSVATRIIDEFAKKRHRDVWASVAYSLRDCAAEQPEVSLKYVPVFIKAAVSNTDDGLFAKLVEGLRLWPENQRSQLIPLLEDHFTEDILAAFPDEKCQVEFLVLVKLVARYAADRAFVLLKRAVVSTDGTAGAAAAAAANIVAHTSEEVILTAILDQLLYVARLAHQRNARNAIHRGLRSIDQKLGRRRVIERFFSVYASIDDPDALKPLIRAIHNLESWTQDDKQRLLADTQRIAGKIRSYVMTLQ
ncbi:MAG TPA: hypothetical protein VLY24_22810 [Bryobacteraceae bacterium]|nr:hypothetical protein [Bryobacteraceae bacterium]